MTQLSRESLIKSSKVFFTGRRKTASARVFIRKGTGKFLVNGRTLENYFGRNTLKVMVLQPFAAVGAANEYDVECTVSGSGLTGQAGAIRHGISRALNECNPVFHVELKAHGLLTRDGRAVERKKYGKKKARKRFQFCKR